MRIVAQYNTQAPGRVRVACCMWDGICISYLKYLASPNSPTENWDSINLSSDSAFCGQETPIFVTEI